MRFPRKLVSRTNRSIVNAGTRSSRVVPFNSLDILFLLGVEREKKERERERERENEYRSRSRFFSLSFLFSFTRGRLVFLGKCVPRVVSPRVHLLLLLNGIR